MSTLPVGLLAVNRRGVLAIDNVLEDFNAVIVLLPNDSQNFVGLFIKDLERVIRVLEDGNHGFEFLHSNFLLEELAEKGRSVLRARLLRVEQKRLREQEVLSPFLRRLVFEVVDDILGSLGLSLLVAGAEGTDALHHHLLLVRPSAAWHLLLRCLAERASDMVLC